MKLTPGILSNVNGKWGNFSWALKLLNLTAKAKLFLRKNTSLADNIFKFPKCFFYYILILQFQTKLPNLQFKFLDYPNYLTHC